MISELKARFSTDHILVGGDWNMTPYEWEDRMPPRSARLQCSTIVQGFMTENNLTDVWRRLNPGIRSSSWFKPNGDGKSRLDYWLVSDDILKYVAQSKNSKAPLSDHCFIDLVLVPTVKESRHKGYWKSNAILLCSGLKFTFFVVQGGDDLTRSIS